MSETNHIKLMTVKEQISLPAVLERRNNFKKLISASIENYDRAFSNCILIQGKAGTGKTTLVTEYLEMLNSKELILGYERVSGHITPQSLYKILKENSSRGKRSGAVPVLVLDDIDCLAENGCLELMKAAFDTKSNSPTNRMVYYMSGGDSSSFRYNGFCIIITNNMFEPGKTTSNQQALLDRVQQMSADLEPDDFKIFNVRLIENYLEDNPDGLTSDEISSVVDLFNNHIRKWLDTDCFVKSGIHFSIRLIKKFIDCQRMFKDNWKTFSIPYKTLEATYNIIKATEIEKEKVQNVESTDVKVEISTRTGKPKRHYTKKHKEVSVA